MLVKPNVEELLKKADNRYELVIATAKRARQIASGSQALTNVKERSEVTLAAKRARQLQEYDVKDVKSKISKAANDFDSGECYIIRDNEETDEEKKEDK